MHVGNSMVLVARRSQVLGTNDKRWIVVAHCSQLLIKLDAQHCRVLTIHLLILKGGRVMIAFFANYSTVAFPLHLPTLKRHQFFGAVANSLGKNSYFPLPLDVRRCILYYVITKIQSCPDNILKTNVVLTKDSESCSKFRGSIQPVKRWMLAKGE